MRIGVNSDLNIPVRRSALKHNLGSRAVKLPHSGVERKHIEVGTSENKAKQQAETKETQVVKSEKSETSDSEAGATAELEKAKLRTKTVSTSHENNLNVLIIIAGGLAWFLFRWSASWRKNEKNFKKNEKMLSFFVFLLKW